MGAALLAALWGLDRYDGELVVGAISACAAVLIAILERVHPHVPDWNIAKGDIKTDATHLLVSMISVPKVISVATFAALYSTGASASAALGVTLWPSELPLLAQAALALLIGELGGYWVHRWTHEFDLLWRLHATHHSAPRLYFLNAARFHPLDTALAYFLSVAPLVLMGCPPSVLALFTVVTGVHGLFQHCNIRLRLGPLNYVFSMAELHRWHHSRTIEESNRNYGANLIIWDLVFGTFFWPRDRQPPDEIGIADMPDFPGGYLDQLRSPFRWPPA